MKPCTHPGLGRWLLLVCFCCCCAFLTGKAHGQSALSGDMETATPDRLEDPGWWPTKGSFPRSSFVGNAICQQCHAGLFRSQVATPMALAARPGGEAQLLRQHMPLAFENGPTATICRSQEAAQSSRLVTVWPASPHLSHGRSAPGSSARRTCINRTVHGLKAASACT